MEYFKFIFLIVTFLFLGCTTVKQNQPKNLGVQKNLFDGFYNADLNKAEKLQLTGKYNGALIEFRKVMEATTDVETYNKACLGAYKCLIATENQPAAVVILKSMNLHNETENNRFLLAVAGEEMLKLGKNEAGESFLEISLDNIDLVETLNSWQAAACSNLAFAYLQNSKLNQAIVMYDKSAEAFKQLNNSKQYLKNKQIAKQIENLIK